MNTHNTEQAGRGYLMYQLAIRGYSVQLTDSRFPLEDLLVVSPTGEHFGIDVKAQRKNFKWGVTPHFNYFSFVSFFVIFSLATKSF